jgi:chemotaxis signal transduction protein
MQTAPWLRFLVHERGFALPVSAVAEVANAAELHLIPLVPRELGGAVNFRGEPLPVLDAAALLSAQGGGRRRHLIVLGDARLRLGLLVSRLVGIERDPGGAVEVDPGPGTPAFVRWVRLGAERVGWLAPEALLEQARTLLTEQRIDGGTMPWHDAF